jgi:hypothetical protein
MNNQQADIRKFGWASLLFVCMSLLVCCPVTMAQKKVQKAKPKAPFQGICGTVVFKSGNFMPGPDRPQPKGQPVVREVLIYKLTNQSQTETNDEGFYTKVLTQKVKTVKSGKDGKFCVSLPVGQYSLFVREEKGLYANLSDERNNIFPVSVQKNRKTPVTVDITYQAAF